MRDIAKPIPSTDCIAKEYIEKKLAELESGEFRAEPLTEIISRDEVIPQWGAKGTLSIKKGGSKTEEHLLGDCCYLWASIQ